MKGAFGEEAPKKLQQEIERTISNLTTFLQSLETSNDSGSASTHQVMEGTSRQGTADSPLLIEIQSPSDTSPTEKPQDGESQIRSEIEFYAKQAEFHSKLYYKKAASMTIGQELGNLDQRTNQTKTQRNYAGLWKQLQTKYEEMLKPLDNTD